MSIIDLHININRKIMRFNTLESIYFYIGNNPHAKIKTQTTIYYIF